MRFSGRGGEKKNREKEERERERERERLRRKSESQLQLVLIIDHDTLSWLLVHYKSLLSVLVTVQSKSKSQPKLHHISRCVTQIRFYRCCSYATVRIRVHKTFVDSSPVRVLCLNESPSRGSSSCFLFSGHIKGRFRCKVSCSIANENDALPTKPRSK